jgi:site-specific DNA-methyltransferase (adenine-specific)
MSFLLNNKKIESNNMDNNNNNIVYNIEEMDLTKLSKQELLAKCEEDGFTKCKSKNKCKLIDIINSKRKIENQKKQSKLIIEEDSEDEKKINIILEKNTLLDKNKDDNSTIEEPIKLEINNTNYNLINGDCLIEMKNIKEKSVDMILCDLPYGMTKNSWDVVIPFDKLWCEYNRIIKDNGAIVLFGSQPFTSLMITTNLNMFRYCLVWEKNKFSDFLNSKRKPMKTNEDIAIFYKKQPTYNPQYWYSTPYTRWNTQTAVDKQSNYGTHKENFVKSDGKRLPTTVLKFNRVERPIHPTQKPTDLLEWLIKTYTNENDLVLDNCMGVGSTGVACKNIKRKFIGIELENKYYETAKESILN